MRQINYADLNLQGQRARGVGVGSEVGGGSADRVAES